MDNSNGIFYNDLMGEFDINISDPVSFTTINVDNIAENTPGNTVVIGNTITSKDIIPDVDITRNIGTVSKRYTTAYIDNVIGTTSTRNRINLTDVINQITFGTGTTTILNSVTPSLNCIVTIPNTGTTTASFVMTESAQSINGAKGFSSPISITPSSNQLVLGSGLGKVTINAVAPFSNVTISIQDPGANANIITSEGAAVINGTKIFTSQLLLSSIACRDTTNQIILGTTNTITLTSPAPVSSKTYTIPDTGANSSFVMTDLAQTINGSKSLTSTLNTVKISPTTDISVDIGDSTHRYNNLYLGTQLINTATTNQLVLGETNAATISAINGASPQTYTIPFCGAASNFLMSRTNQSCSGAITLTNNTGSTSQTTGTLIVQGGIGCNGESFFPSIKFGTTGGTPSSFQYYDETSFSTGTAGAWGTSNPTVTGKIIRVGSLVSIYLNTKTAASSTAASIVFTTNLAANYRPSTTIDVPFNIVNNGPWSYGVLRIATTGQINIYATPATGSFSATGTIGFTTQSFSYPIT